MVEEVVITAISAVLTFILLLPIVTGVMKWGKERKKREYDKRLDWLYDNGWKCGDRLDIDIPYFHKKSECITQSKVMNMTRIQWRRFVNKNLSIKS